MRLFEEKRRVPGGDLEGRRRAAAKRDGERDQWYETGLSYQPDLLDERSIERPLYNKTRSEAALGNTLELCVARSMREDALNDAWIPAFAGMTNFSASSGTLTDYLYCRLVANCI